MAEVIRLKRGLDAWCAKSAEIYAQAQIKRAIWRYRIYVCVTECQETENAVVNCEKNYVCVSKSVRERKQRKQ